MTGAQALPIDAVLPELLAALTRASNAVVIAPPGAGKTTSVAPALLDQPWCGGQVLLLSPRRLAARAAAEYIAARMGETVGGLVGYATRLDSKISSATRLLVMTEGIFRSRIIADPELAGVSAVLFDEVHERNLDGDFGLALALEAQAALRPDIRLVAMSATLDGERFAALMGGAPVVVSEGRSHPLDVRHIGRNADLPVEAEVARAVRSALSIVDNGDILAFLPGVREIERTADLLRHVPAALHLLHGQVEPEHQRAALRPDSEGRRKVILATNIAETSLTIDGVRIVIDSGLARRVRYDAAAATARLVTERASQAAVTQRAGRAARQGPGVAFRLWEAAATAGMPPFDPPEITEADLAPLLLDCAAWGEHEPARLPWLDPPPDAALNEARVRLECVGALDAAGAITAHGRAISALPLPVALAHMVIMGRAMGLGGLAADVAMLLSERGLGGRDADVTLRYRRWHSDRGARAETARRAARRWAGGPGNGGTGDAQLTDQNIARLIATAYPERVSRRRAASGTDWASAGGRGYRLDAASPLASSGWLAVAEVQGTAGGARIVAAAPIDDALAEAWVADHGEVHSVARYSAQNDRVEALREHRLGAIILSRVPDHGAVDPAALLMEAVRAEGLALLPWPDNARALRTRAQFAGLSSLDDALLIATIDEWLAPVLQGRRRFADIAGGQLHDALWHRLSWEEQRLIDRVAPAQFTSPAQSAHAIDYAAPAGPTVTIRVQALFGLDRHPTVGSSPVPLALQLTSPAGRPIQATTDLPGFWRGSWADVAREMRGRYPKHPWPEQPWLAAATLRTKRADAARAGGDSA